MEKFIRNPIEPWTLSFKHGGSYARPVDEETPSVPDQPTIEELEEDVCTLHWTYVKSSLGKEFEMLVEEGGEQSDSEERSDEMRIL